MAVKSVINYQIPRNALTWLLVLMFLLIAPHASWLPVWVRLLCGLCAGWRILIHLGKAAYPGRIVRVFLVFIVMPLSIFQFRSLGAGIGVDLSVCLLILGASFKLLEMRDRRDIYIIIALAFMLALSGFIYSQTLLTAVYNIFSVMLIITAMVLLNRDSSHSQASSLRLAGILLLQSMPLMLILFILVPRITPLWAMPLPVGASKTGVTDEMTPGQISQLGRSGELAFRVKFNGQTPSHDQLYWRGLVLDQFDGQTWTRSSGPLLPRMQEIKAAELQPVLEYDVILEATQQPWLYGIKLAQVTAPEVILDRNDTLLTVRPVNQRYRYLARSYPETVSDLTLHSSIQRRALQLPTGDNPRSRAYANELRAIYADEREYVQAVLRSYNQQPFYYTLTPPALNGESIDEFMFDTREGFCGHYAGSFVYLMRAAGIPARVVVGYQGAEYNPFEDYLMVYQYNAHAWAEVWLEGEGWIRFDPTAWVAPERINQGMEAVFGASSGFLEGSRFSMMRFTGMPWLNTMRLRLDAAEYNWNRWVISYDSDLQMQLLKDLFGENERQRALLALIGLTALSMALAAVFMVWLRRRATLDPRLALYLELTDALAAKGLSRLPAEGPLAYCERVAHYRPDLKAEMNKITEQFIHILYKEPEQEIAAASKAYAAATSRLRSQVRMLIVKLLD